MKKASALIITFVFTFFCLSAPARQIFNIFSTTEVNAAVWDGTASSGFAGGTGTAANPYLIATPQQLKYFANVVSGGNSYSGKYIRLVSDIQLNDTSTLPNWGTTPPPNTWVSIGGGDSFSGTFDGGNHKITGVYINASGDYHGFFALTAGATVKNLNSRNTFLHFSFQISNRRVRNFL